MIGEMPMNASDEMAAQLATERHQSGSIAPGSDEFDKFDERVRGAIRDFRRASDYSKSIEDIQNHLSLIDRRLDHETSARRAIYYHLVATEREMKRQRSLRFARYFVAICIGVVAGALAWQSYGEASKQIIAARVPELGWSPQAKQTIAGWVEQLGWTKPPPDHENTAIPSSPQAAPDAVTPNAGQQNLAAVRESLKELAARQDQMEHDITKLQAVDMEILAQTPSPLGQPPDTPASNSTHPPPSSRQP